MYHSLAIGKGVLRLSKLFNRAGSTWPGHLALKTDARLIKKVLLKNPEVKVVLIAGTNGKTTTTKALAHILEVNGISTLTNTAGANLLNGLASLLVAHVTIGGTLKHKAIIFEVDENTLPLVLEEIPEPHAIILLNLFRDQLDRYGEVNTTAEKWKESVKKFSDKTLVVANADDPQIAHIAASAKNKVFFTVDNVLKKSKILSHAVDSTTCPECNNPLSYSAISYSHLGNYKCSNCDFQNPKAKQYAFKSSLLGTYNNYNLSSIILLTDKLFGILPYDSTKSLSSFEPAFGRQETIDIDGRKVMVLLSKNPTGLNESLKVAIENNSSTILILLNDRIPDGRDISWIWDVDFEMLLNKNAKVYVSGERSYDLANRLLFANITHEVFEKFEKAYQQALSQTPKGKILTILPTYSAMLEIRKFISGKAIL